MPVATEDPLHVTPVDIHIVIERPNKPMPDRCSATRRSILSLGISITDSTTYLMLHNPENTFYATQYSWIDGHGQGSGEGAINR